MVTHAAPVEVVRHERPYRPSWVDALQARLDRSRAAAFAFYAGLPLCMFGAAVATHWIGGTVATGAFPTVHLLVPGNFLIAMLAMHVLDHTASNALERFRSVLSLDDREMERLRYRLTHLPARGGLLAAAAGLLNAAVGLIVFLPNYRELYPVFTSPLSQAIEGVNFTVMWIATATFIYHSLRQLTMVRFIYDRCTRVELFRLDAVYAFSWLTARTSLGLAAIGYLWFFGGHDVYEAAPETYVYLLGFTLLAGVVFVWPLWGVHRLLTSEKRRKLDQLGAQLQTAIARLGAASEAEDLSQVDALQKLVTGLSTSRAEVDRISTWPWRPDTSRLVTTALLLPLLVYVAQRVIAGAIGV